MTYFIIPGIETKKLQLSVDECFEIVLKFTGINEKALKSKTRIKSVVTARHLYHALARNLNIDVSFSEIGKLTKREHSTVMNSCRKVKEYKDLQEKYTELLKYI